MLNINTLGQNTKEESHQYDLGFKGQCQIYLKSVLTCVYQTYLARHIYPSLVLVQPRKTRVQPRKTRPFITERSLMGRKESNQTNKTNYLAQWLPLVC